MSTGNAAAVGVGAHSPTHPPPRCAVSDRSLCNAVQRCLELQVIDLSGIRRVTNDFVDLLAARNLHVRARVPVPKCVPRVRAPLALRALSWRRCAGQVLAPAQRAALRPPPVHLECVRVAAAGGGRSAHARAPAAVEVCARAVRGRGARSHVRGRGAVPRAGARASPMTPCWGSPSSRSLRRTSGAWSAGPARACVVARCPALAPRTVARAPPLRQDAKLHQGPGARPSRFPCLSHVDLKGFAALSDRGVSCALSVRGCSAARASALLRPLRELRPPARSNARTSRSSCSTAASG